MMLCSVTVVGATQGVPPESAADFSSGGFSNVSFTDERHTDVESQNEKRGVPYVADNMSDDFADEKPESFLPK